MNVNIPRTKNLWIPLADLYPIFSNLFKKDSFRLIWFPFKFILFFNSFEYWLGFSLKSTAELNKIIYKVNNLRVTEI